VLIINSLFFLKKLLIPFFMIFPKYGKRKAAKNGGFFK
jgi:hypothetical protein